MYTLGGTPSSARRCELEFESPSSHRLLHHLWTVVLCGIAHHFRLIDWGVAASIRVRGAVRRTLSAAFDEDMSLSF